MNLPQLTFTRFIAAIGIVFLHYAVPSLVKLSPAVGAPFHYINSFVSYFFLLSGFILVVSSAAKTGQPADWQFWLNRFARVYPLYLFALLLTATIVAVFAGSEFLYVGNSFAKPALSSVFVAQAWLPDYTYYLNYPSWSLSVEALFYALFPFLFRALSQLSTRLLLTLSAACWVLNQLLHIFLKTNGWAAAFTNAFPPFHLPTFLMGVCLGIGFIRHSAYVKAQKRLVTAGLVALLALTSYLIISQSLWVRHFEVGLFAPVFALIILYLCTHTNGLTRLFSQPRAVYLGEISYGVYILQAPVAMLVRQLNIHYLHGSVPVTFLVLLALLLPVSSLCYEWIEKPCRRWLRRSLPVQSTQPIPHQLPVEQITQ